MRTIVAYDIADDAHRARFAAILAAFGERIQQSVFLCELDDESRRLVVSKAEELIDHDNDRVHLIAQCPDCLTLLHTVGQSHVPKVVEYWIV
ncbi:MAG TPA: CRISPR-associated endonuclease Cas2 [Kineosporiaceae bacterium]